MALRFVDGFDHYVTADLAKKWTTVVGAPSVGSGNGRRSTNGLSALTTVDYAVALTLDNQPTWIVGFALSVSALPSATVTPLQLLDGATAQLALGLTPTGALTVSSGAAVLGTTSALMAGATYAYIELAATIHNTTGSITVRVNGATALTLTSQDTQQSANAYAQTIRLGAPTTGGGFIVVNIDDLYICDGTGSAPHNTLLGDCRVDTLLPNADGTSQQWTPSTPGAHYTLVDDAAPNTTDYVSSATIGHRDTYGMQDLAAFTATIYGVQLNLAALKSDAGARSVKPLILSGASEGLGTSTVLSTSQTYTKHIQTTDPATATAWTEAGINALQCGAEVGA